MSKSSEEMTGLVFDIQKFSLHDGPGIRTLVLLKGCPLRCLWCCNPESQSARPEVVCFAEKCIRKDGHDCRDCLQHCPAGALRLTEEGAVALDHDRCEVCATCADVCPSGAFTVFGASMTVEDVFAQVDQDRIFYRRSGGGVTLSGGEPAMQPEFSAALLRRFHEAGLHTAMETCGHAPWDVMERLLSHLDLVLYDLKHMDSEVHRALVGVPNDLILDNARRTAATGVEMAIRVPVVPGHNDSDANLEATACFVREIGVGRVHLLPYHDFGAAKYRRLGLKYKLAGLPRPHDKEMECFRPLFESYGLTVKIGG